MMPLCLSDRQMREVMDAASLVPWDLRDAYLQQVAAELQGKDLTDADGLVHRVAHRVAREVRWDAGKMAAVG